jgi:O-glycosyl hydrolase
MRSATCKLPAKPHVKNTEKQASAPARIDPQVAKFMSGVGVHLVGRDPTHPNQVIWRREPMVQGEEVTYEFSTREQIEFGNYFHMELADSIYEAGFIAGQSALQSKIKHLLGLNGPA